MRGHFQGQANLIFFQGTEVPDPLDLPSLKPTPCSDTRYCLKSGMFSVHASGHVSGSALRYVSACSKVPLYSRS